MDDSRYLFQLDVESCLRRALPYGDLPSKDSPQSAFFEAAKEGDLGRLRELASGKDAAEKAWLADLCITGVGPLQAAARLGRLDVVKCFIEELGFDIDAGSREGITALAAASTDGRMDVVRYLLDHGANPNKTDDVGCVPLHCAAKQGQDEVARLLLSRGAAVDTPFSPATPLFCAALHGKTGVMKVLLEHHANPNRGRTEGQMPLLGTLYAASNGLPESISLKCVELLVEAGADVNYANPDVGEATPLVVATSYCLTDCIKYLLKAGADPNIPHYECGFMPIQLAASLGRRNLVELLFPLTSPIQSISDWTVEGIMAHAKSGRSKHTKRRSFHKEQGELEVTGLGTRDAVKQVGENDEKTNVQLKLCGDESVKRKDYRGASVLYTKAIQLDPTDATLYSNRSLCHLPIAEAKKALVDAEKCIKLRPGWLKGHYRCTRKHAMLLWLGLKLDPGNAEMEKALEEAIQAMKEDHLAGKSLKPYD